MSEEKLIEFVIQERIESALNNLARQKKSSNEENKKVLEAERIIDNLSENERFHVKFYIDNFISDMALQEICLYKQGFNDGVKTIKLMISL